MPPVTMSGLGPLLVELEESDVAGAIAALVGAALAPAEPVDGAAPEVESEVDPDAPASEASVESAEEPALEDAREGDVEGWVFPVLADDDEPSGVVDADVGADERDGELLDDEVAVHPGRGIDPALFPFTETKIDWRAPDAWRVSVVDWFAGTEDEDGLTVPPWLVMRNVCAVPEPFVSVTPRFCLPATHFGGWKTAVLGRKTSSVCAGVAPSDGSAAAGSAPRTTIAPTAAVASGRARSAVVRRGDIGNILRISV